MPHVAHSDWIFEHLHQPLAAGDAPDGQWGTAIATSHAAQTDGATSLIKTLWHRADMGGELIASSSHSPSPDIGGTTTTLNTPPETPSGTTAQGTSTSALQTLPTIDPTIAGPVTNLSTTTTTTTTQTIAGPVTNLHYTANGNFDASGNYLPGQDGFNLADVSSVSALDSLPAGVKGLVWLGLGNGVDATFLNAVKPYIGDSHLFGFYLVDEPDPSTVSAANLKAESDWIHANIPGAETFIVLQNFGTPTSPSYVNTYNPGNTDIDLFGLDPYPVRPQFPGGVDYSVIPDAVTAAEAAGIPLAKIVPVYQAFGGGGYSSWTLPTASQEQQILATWASVVPTPVFDYAYSWGSQDGDSSLSGSPELQQVFAEHNAVTSAPAPTVPLPTALASSVQVTENQTYTFKTSDFGYSDLNGTTADPLASVTVTSLPTTGTLDDNGSPVTAGEMINAADIAGGKLTFVPNTGVTATGSFDFEVTDTLDDATSANAAAMTIDIIVPTVPHHSHHK
jgi:hypothetical protein